MKKYIFGLLVIILSLCAFYFLTLGNMKNIKEENSKGVLNSNSTSFKKAYFAGGCFWCLEGIFEAQNGVKESIAGYAGGTQKDATYELVSSGTTDHREAVEVTYNPNIISLETLINLYYTQIDPTQVDGQFHDIGYRYTTAIYYQTNEEKQIIEKVQKELTNSKKFSKPIAVKIEQFTTFFSAEEYHQNYYKNSVFRYNLYKKGSGREEYIKKTWGKEISALTETDLKKKLTPLQFSVTQKDGTEPPFDNQYRDNHEDGIYVDVVDGTPLFSSKDKYDSGTGWPSFTKPINEDAIVDKEDYKLFMTRTEVRSKNSNSHLGHVFDDGPKDKGGQRYCMNSAALKFIPEDEFTEDGYGEYSKLF